MLATLVNDRSTIPGHRALLETDPRVEQCQCGPFVDTRTPDEICATKYNDKGTTIFCNAGGYFPDLKSGCEKYYVCNDGKAISMPCAPGTCTVGQIKWQGPHHITHRDRV